MDELDIRLLAETDPDGAINAARAQGMKMLADELSAAHRRYNQNVFMLIRDAKVSVRDAAEAAQMPLSTAQAAALGRTKGGMTYRERERLYNYVMDKIVLLNRAKRVLQGKPL